MLFNYGTRVNPKVLLLILYKSLKTEISFSLHQYVYYGMFEDVYRRKSFLAGGIFSTVVSQVLGACILSFA